MIEFDLVLRIWYVVRIRTPNN